MEHLSLRYRILIGYILLISIVGSMVAILLYEHRQMNIIESEAHEVQLIRYHIVAVHQNLINLSILGENVIGWVEADSTHYRTLRLRTDSLLQALKSHCRDYVRPAQIDTLRTLLAEKEAHLLYLTEILARQDEADSLLVNHLPEVARRATRIRTVKQKKSGLAGHWAARKLCKCFPPPRNCTSSATA